MPSISIAFRSAGLMFLMGMALGHCAVAEEFTNHAGMTFVDIPAGKFYMGSCRQANTQTEVNKKRAFLNLPLLGGECPSGAAIDAKASDDELPQHEVRLGAFQLDQHEVTLKSFKKFLADSGKANWVTPVFIQFNASGDNAPVTMVSWNDAQEFIVWLNKSKPASDKGEYRLPSEAEWEYAARAKSRALYAHGDDAERLADYAWFLDNAEHKTHPVAQKKPNAFNLYDMHGNVWEWTEDCWHNNYEDAPNTGKAWESRGCNQRVLRGGSWDFSAKLARSANRNQLAPDRVGFDIGFRVVRILPPIPASK